MQTIALDFAAIASYTNSHGLGFPLGEGPFLGSLLLPYPPVEKETDPVPNPSAMSTC
jgi:hypothetical protein